MSTPSDPLNTRAFALACGVVPETVREWVRLGYITPDFRTPRGKHLRFTQAQVDEVKQGRPSERAMDIEAHVLAARARQRMRRGRAG